MPELVDDDDPRLSYFRCELCREMTPTTDTIEDSKRLFEERNPGKTYEPGRMEHYCDECYELMNKPLAPGRYRLVLTAWPAGGVLPLPLLDPVLKEPPEYDLYAISFKEIQINFGETLGNDVSLLAARDPGLLP
mgnify:CR=1 FL=1